MKNYIDRFFENTSFDKLKKKWDDITVSKKNNTVKVSELIKYFKIK